MDIQRRQACGQKNNQTMLFLIQQDINVVCCTISLFNEIHKENRDFLMNIMKYIYHVKWRSL